MISRAMQTTGTYPYSLAPARHQSIYKEHVFDLSDVVTMIRGKHILHFGGELLMYRDNSTAWGNVNAGVCSTPGSTPGSGHSTACGAWLHAGCIGTGFEYADFLLGYINNWNARHESGVRSASEEPADVCSG